MSENKFPADWDEQKVRRVLAHCEEQTEEDALAVEPEDQSRQDQDRLAIQPQEGSPEVRLL